MLKPDDPYDLMRRSRLLEPRSSRARSTSPLRLQKEQARGGGGGAGKTASPKVATVEPMSRTEWFDCTSDAAALIDDNCAKHTVRKKVAVAIDLNFSNFRLRIALETIITWELREKLSLRASFVYFFFFFVRGINYRGKLNVFR